MNFQKLELRLHEYVENPQTNIMVQYPDIFIRHILDIAKECDSKPTRKKRTEKS